MGRSKSSRRAKRRARLRRENGTNMPHAPPPSTSPSASTTHSLARALSHAKTSEREIACLAIIRAFETGTAVACSRAPEAVSDGKCPADPAGAPGRRAGGHPQLGRGRFEEHHILRRPAHRPSAYAVQGAGRTERPHHTASAPPSRDDAAELRAGGRCHWPRRRPRWQRRVQIPRRAARGGPEHVRGQPSGHRLRRGIDQHPRRAVPAARYARVLRRGKRPQVPWTSAAPVRTRPGCVHGLPSSCMRRPRTTSAWTKTCGGPRAARTSRHWCAIDHVSSHRLAGCGGRMHVIHWHMLGVLSNLYQTFDDYVGVIDREAKLLWEPRRAWRGGRRAGARIQTCWSSGARPKGRADQAGQQAERPLSPLLDALAAINLGMEVLGNILEFDESRQAREHVLSNCWDLALGMARLASANLLLPWRARMGAGTEALKETLTLQCVDVNVHAANFVESFLHHFDPTSHVITRNNTVHKFETLWFDLSTAAYRNVTLREKLSKENPPLSLVASGGMAELATQLMRASEQACRCFLEANATARLDTPKRLDVVVRVALHDRGGAVLDEARSSALRVLGHHAVLAPGTLATHFGGVCVQLLKPGVDAAVASILVLVTPGRHVRRVWERRYGSRVSIVGTFSRCIFAQHQRLTFFFLPLSPVFPLCARSTHINGGSVAARVLFEAMSSRDIGGRQEWRPSVSKTHGKREAACRRHSDKLGRVRAVQARSVMSKVVNGKKNTHIHLYS